MESDCCCRTVSGQLRAPGPSVCLDKDHGSSSLNQIRKDESASVEP